MKKIPGKVIIQFQVNVFFNGNKVNEGREPRFKDEKTATLIASSEASYGATATVIECIDHMESHRIVTFKPSEIPSKYTGLYSGERTPRGIFPVSFTWDTKNPKEE